MDFSSDSQEMLASIQALKGKVYMHFFTSIMTNYLPKARVLAHSVKKHCPNSFFTLLVSDKLPSDFCLEKEPFDEVLYIEDLDINVSNLNMWIYQHTVVELCTAVKGPALVKLLKAGRSDKVIYLDPDIVVFSSLTELENTLDKSSVVITPHITIPESSHKGILDNEICALQHGIYNLGFLAVKNTFEGLRFAEWWRDRLVSYCYDDIPRGLFTDQRWIDMVPAMFEDIHIERSPAYNVATWNLSTRKVTMHGENYYVNEIPLQFYHFSGFDSGANFEMMKQYGDSPVLWKLREWYVVRQEEEGQSILGKSQGVYSFYSDGEIVPHSHRRLLSMREDVQKYFADKNPFLIEGDCVYTWMQNEAPKFTNDNASLEELIRINSMLLAENQKFRKILSPLILIRRAVRSFIN